MRGANWRKSETLGAVRHTGSSSRPSMTGARSARTPVVAGDACALRDLAKRNGAAINAVRTAAGRSRQLSIRRVDGNARLDTALHRLVGLLLHFVTECKR